MSNRQHLKVEVLQLQKYRLDFQRTKTMLILEQIQTIVQTILVYIPLTDLNLLDYNRSTDTFPNIPPNVAV